MATRVDPEKPGTERRTISLLRVPFIRRCELRFDEGPPESAFIINVNVLGAYIARDAMPGLGDLVTVTVRVPGKDADMALRGAVTWLNARQQHPVHSLPPGFGLKFLALGAEDRRCIEAVVDEYAARNPQLLR
jgi:hypothetical protein